MSQVWSTRAAGVAAALVMAGPWSVPGSAGAGPAGAAAAGVTGHAGGVAASRVTPALAREPLPVGGLLTATPSPVLVPPAAPVDVAVSSVAFAGRRVDVQVTSAGEWVTVARVTLDGSGRARVRLARVTAGRYDVRAVAEVAPGAWVRGAARGFTVTVTGLGDPRAYRYLLVHRGAPARWNPCAVVTYRVRGATDARLADLREALRRVTYETGVRFRELGETGYVPGARGFRYEADLVVAWADKTETSLLGRNRAAVGGFENPVAGRGGKPRIRNGFVVVDDEVARSMPGGFGRGETQGQVLLHELGHVMGLDHVAADHQIMREQVEGDVAATLYGAGDLTGLRRIGRAAGCL